MLTATKNESLLATRTRRVVERRSDRSAASLPAAVLVGLMVVALAGCSSTSDAPRTADASTSTAPVVREPAEILALDLDDSGELASLELEADRPLVWTSFRNPEGDLVVELPNSVPLPSLVDMAPAGGLIESVDVEQIEDSERPLTRLTVATREPSEHSLVGDGDRLRLQLLPIDSAQKVTLAYEPVEEEATEPPRVEPVEVADLDPVSPAPEAPTVVAPPIAEQRGVPQTYGTPESPQRGPSPSGAVASALLGVDVLEEGASTVVQIEGDGEFVYSTFRLENPERFVIDLEGVVNGSATSAVTVRSDRVERIRVGQFKPRPAPVSRVVFDLRETTVPSIVPVAEGLTVLFGDATTAVAAVAPASVEPVEQPPVETTPEPVTPEPVVVADLDETAPQPSTDEPAPAPVDDPFAVEPEPVAEVAPADPIVDAVAQAPPPVQMYQQTPDPLPAGEAVTFAGNGEPANVALYEAQDVQLDDADIRRERLLDSFGELVVNREDREYVGEPITMTLRDADLVETLRSFAKISDLNFVIQPGVRGSVTVELNSVPWDQALEQILKINNLGMDIDGTIVRIAPRSVLSDEAEQA
ncbi:MAG: AMIN domain-containing protein, partial [Acidobacteriota bacterium]